MPRFFVSHPRIEKGILRIDGNEARHIRRVLRLKRGDEIVVFDGSAKEYEGKIIEEGPSFVEIMIQGITFPKRESQLEITLAQSLLKGEKMDYLIQKATELGIKTIIPFFSSRSIPIFDKTKTLSRCHRWERIAVEAAKQCGRVMVPRIEPPRGYPDMLQTASLDSYRFILWERKGKKLKNTLADLKEMMKIFFVVGPEGGLIEEEVAYAEQLGFIPIRLGERILRSETTSLSLLSIFQYEWGDIG